MRRIAFDHHQVSLLAHGDRSDAVQLSQELRAVGSRDVDCFHWGESSFDQKLDLALIAEAGDDASHSSGIQPGQQQSTCLGESVLEFHFFLECRSPGRGIAAVDLSQVAHIARAKSVRQQ